MSGFVTSLVLLCAAVASAVSVTAPQGGSGARPFGGYGQIQDEGTPLQARSVLNMIGAGVFCVDNPPLLRTDCTFIGGGGGGVSITCGAGTLCTPSPIITTGDIATASQEAHFLNDGGTTSLTCGGSNQGKAQVMDSGVLQYCDGATTSVLQTAALANGLGVALSAAIVTDGNRGDITISGGAWGITPGVVQNSDMVTMPAHTHKGNNTGSAATPIDLTQAQLTADLNLFSPSLQGMTPASGGGATNFLRADGTWQPPPGSTTNMLNSAQHLDTTTASVSRGDLITGQGASPTWSRLAKGTASQVLQMDGSGTDIIWGAATNFNGALLNTTLFTDVTAAGPTRGDLITAQGATPKWQRLAKGTAGQCLQMDGTATDIAWGSCAGGASNHNLLSATHPDTVPASPVRGDLITANSTPAWTKIALGSAQQLLKVNSGGTDVQWGAATCEAGGGFAGSFPSTCARNFDQLSPVAPSTGKGQLIAGSGAASGSGTVNQALAAGTNGQLLQADPSQTLGMRWANPTVTPVTLTAGVDCTGASDSATGLQNAVNALASTGATLLVPSQCRLGLGSPSCSGAACTASGVPFPCCTGSGTGPTCCGPSITIPNNVHITCADPSAGFFAVRKRCVGGTYPDAACATNAECTGGGICGFDFGASTYAPTAANSYMMFADGNAMSSDIFIENCSFWTYQADPYQRCVGGTSAGNPCRQECDNASQAPGQRCQANTDCQDGGHPSGVCLRTADCAAGGGTCSGAPHSAAGTTAGTDTGSINPLDLNRTINVRMRQVSIYDHFKGTFGLRTGQQSTMFDINVAREITDGTSPFSTPSSSTCFSPTNITACNYGAADNQLIGGGGVSANTQPTTAVTNGVVVGADSQMTRVTSRGSSSAITTGARTRLDECTVWPAASFNFLTYDHLGPGTPGGGYTLAATSQVAKSFALDIVNGGTCVNLTGADSGAIGVKCNSESLGAGILVAGDRSHALGNNIKGVNAASAVGVRLSGTNDSLSNTYIEGSSATGTGIDVPGAVASVTGNSINSTPVDSLQNGMVIAGPGVQILGNSISRVKRAAFEITGTETIISGNVSSLSPAAATASLQPIHVLNDGAGNHQIVVGNQFGYGWRGYASGTRATGLLNTQISNNRFLSLSGAPLAAGGAGLLMQGNYINTNSLPPSPGLGLTCDASCTTPGILCTQDSDCGTCTSTFKCIPEPVAGFVGSPTVGSLSQTHNAWIGNHLFSGQVATQQCQAGGGTVTFAGAQCDVSLSTCTGGGGTCAGGPPSTCSGGTQNNKRCCAGTGANTCSVRTPTPFIRVLEFPGVSSGGSLWQFALNTIFGAVTLDNFVGVDMVSSGTLGANFVIADWIIADNNWNAPGATSGVAIKFPTNFSTISGVTLSGNWFKGWGPTPSANFIANYRGSFGSISLVNGHPAAGSGAGLNTGTTTQFFPVTGIANANLTTETLQNETMMGSGTWWKGTCTCNAAPGGTATRVITLRKNAGSTAATCTITSAIQECSLNSIAPISFASGDELNWQQVGTGSGNLCTTISCISYISHDTVL